MAFNESMAALWDRRREPAVTISLTKKQARWAADKGWEDGARAYACKQAWIRRAQAMNWLGELAEIRVTAATFLSTHSAEGMCVEPLEGLVEGVKAMEMADVEDVYYSDEEL